MARRLETEIMTPVMMASRFQGRRLPASVKKFAHLFGLGFTPLEIRSVELNALVSHSGDGTHCALGILFERVTDGIQFETNRNGRRRPSGEGPRLRFQR